MALTSTTTFDIVNQTQTITFYQSATLIDQLVYSSNQVTFETISSFSLSKSDFALYMKYLGIYYNLLIVNFPVITTLFPLSWPSNGTSFTIHQTYPPLKIVYTQVSVGATALNVSYLPLAITTTFSSRGTPVAISMQEWASGFDLLNQFATQVAAN